jgi:ribulose-5-phosphate 4-epimerase/fuculose-1-phosphate aldolase
MEFFVHRSDCDPVRDQAAQEIIQELEGEGHTMAAAEEEARFVLHMTSADNPRPFRRRSRAVFVVSLAAVNRHLENVRSLSYTALVRSLSNVMLTVVPCRDGGSAEMYFTTPEAGFFHCPFDARTVCMKLLPQVSTHLVIGNRLSCDLPRSHWDTSPVVEGLKRHGRELDHLGVLPAPFPLRELLSQDTIEHLYRLFGMTGLSYGNLSARESIPGKHADTFWMTARGANKARLMGIGRDILLVTGYDEASGEILVSVPPGCDPRARVSVDAIEHALIYRRFPGVGAIVHVHAWIAGVPATLQSWPCGTRQLADEVAGLVLAAPDPSRAVIGLRNHGLTIVGRSLDEIFERIEGRLTQEVPVL